jgi:acid phosphatase type 7
MGARKDDGRGAHWFGARGRTLQRHLLFIAAALAAVGLAAWLTRTPTAALRSQTAEADFAIPDADLSRPLKIIAYGDMRFTDPRETEATNPKIRSWLVDKIAAEKPDAVLLSGDVPWHGGDAHDYEVYRSETTVWRKGRLRIYPALGNHEFQGSESVCLENWWNAFPELRGLRWYSVELGHSVYILNLDSNSSLEPGSPQMAWLRDQVVHLPVGVQFVFFNLHHPPVVDFQKNGDVSHNGRSNEKALAQFLAQASEKRRARFIVVAGHVHNYERFLQEGIVYLVSGGGGAKPYPIVRGPADLYQDPGFPNYHYVKFVEEGDGLAATMVRVADPGASSPSWQEKDHFEIAAPSALPASAAH